MRTLKLAKNQKAKKYYNLGHIFAIQQKQVNGKVPSENADI